MKKLLLVLALVASSACASLKTQVHDRYHNTDGSVNVRIVLQDVSYGIEADCAFGQTALAKNVCLYGRAAVEAAMGVSTSDHGLLLKSVDTILQQAAHDKPALEPYFAFAMRIFEGITA